MGFFSDGPSSLERPFIFLHEIDLLGQHDLALTARKTSPCRCCLTMRWLLSRSCSAGTSIDARTRPQSMYTGPPSPPSMNAAHLSSHTLLQAMV